jgi:hypothetical protein
VIPDRDQLRRLQERALALLPPAEDERPERRPAVVVDDDDLSVAPAAVNGQAPAAPTPTPPPPVSSSTVDEHRPPAGPAPAVGAPGALDELPPGADPEDWEWVADEPAGDH